jgi:signal transduction histidine kinase/FixJ family two-component response regulator
MILIVDDKPENIFALKSLLAIHSFEVDTASSGEEALKKILKNSYALIILDVQMPEMDGFEVAEAISGYSKSKDIPIIFLSAVNTHKKFITKGYTSGGIDYVTKPFDPDILLLKVKTFYRLSEQTRQLNAMERSLREEIEQKNKAEQLLQENVEELKSILESIPQIAFTTRADGSVEYVNHHWYSYSSEKCIFPVTEGLSIQAGIEQAIQTTARQQYEVRMRSLTEGIFRFHMLHLTPVWKDGAIIKWVGIFTDIHEQKMASQLLEKRVEERTMQLRSMNQRLEESNRELQQFAFIASHDLQEPLRKIQTFSNIVLTKHTPGDEKARTFLEKIVRSAERLRKLVTSLLEYSSIREDEVFVHTDLQAILQDVLNDMELKIRSSNAQIYLGSLPEIEALPFQIRQMFQNLVSNALKFSKECAACEIYIHAERIVAKSVDAPASGDGDYCRIVVRDAGIGFNEMYKDKIFEIFQRLNPREIYEGMGIGLSIVKKVIDRHNGLIAVKSKENIGTEFTIILPVRQTNTPAAIALPE